MKTEFRIKENGFNEIKKSIIIKTLPLLALALAVSFSISHFKSNGQTSDTDVLYLVIPIVIISIGLGLFKGLRRQKELFESYKLIISASKKTLQN